MQQKYNCWILVNSLISVTDYVGVRCVLLMLSVASLLQCEFADPQPSPPGSQLNCWAIDRLLLLVQAHANSVS